jgi:hypothetical protein
MNDKQKHDEYIDLVQKLMSYMLDNAKVIKKLPGNASYIAFSSTNEELYAYAQKILESVKKAHEDQPIVKAVEQKSNNTWKFTTITP